MMSSRKPVIQSTNRWEIIPTITQYANEITTSVYHKYNIDHYRMTCYEHALFCEPSAHGLLKSIHARF